MPLKAKQATTLLLPHPVANKTHQQVPHQPEHHLLLPANHLNNLNSYLFHPPATFFSSNSYKQSLQTGIEIVLTNRVCKCKLLSYMPYRSTPFVNGEFYHIYNR